MPTSRRHAIDFENPIVQLPYLGESVEDVFRAAEDDGWKVRVIHDDPDYQWPEGTSIRDKANLVTLEVKYDQITLRERNGRVIRISAY